VEKLWESVSVCVWNKAKFKGIAICGSEIEDLDFLIMLRLELCGVLGLKSVFEVLLHWKKEWLFPIDRYKEKKIRKKEKQRVKF